MGRPGSGRPDAQRDSLPRGPCCVGAGDGMTEPPTSSPDPAAPGERDELLGTKVNADRADAAVGPGCGDRPHQPAGGPARGADPAPGDKQLPVDHGVPGIGGVSQQDRDLGILHAARSAGVLALDPTVRVPCLVACHRWRPNRASSATSQWRPTRSSARVRRIDQPCSTKRHAGRRPDPQIPVRPAARRGAPARRPPAPAGPPARRPAPVGSAGCGKALLGGVAALAGQPLSTWEQRDPALAQ
jgi:hypothetical protein